MMNFERLIQCNSVDEVVNMLILVKDGYCVTAFCDGRLCHDDSGCRQCLKEWLLNEFPGQKSDEYKPRHMRVDA